MAGRMLYRPVAKVSKRRASRFKRRDGGCSRVAHWLRGKTQPDRRRVGSTGSANIRQRRQERAFYFGQSALRAFSPTTGNHNFLSLTRNNLCNWLSWKLLIIEAITNTDLRGQLCLAGRQQQYAKHIPCPPVLSVLPTNLIACACP